MTAVHGRSGRSPRRLAATLALSLTVAGCYRSTRDPETVERLARLEARVAEQEKALAEARSQPSSVELAVLAQKLAEVSQQLAALDEKLARTPSVPPTPVKRRTPDPAATYAVPVGASPVFGSPKAKVTMVMAFEFACPYCRKAWDTVDDLRKKYGNDLRVVYKQYVVHPQVATLPAQAACAAHKQGRWRPMAELLWTKAFEARQFDAATIDAIALEAGLDVTQYQVDVTGPCAQEVKDEQALLHKVAVNATPSFFINGRFMSGARDIAEFSRLIDEELAEAAALVKKGVKAERLYDQEIVGKGIAEIPMP